MKKKSKWLKGEQKKVKERLSPMIKSSGDKIVKRFLKPVREFISVDNHRSGYFFTVNEDTKKYRDNFDKIDFSSEAKVARSKDVGLANDFIKPCKAIGI